MKKSKYRVASPSPSPSPKFFDGAIEGKKEMRDEGLFALPHSYRTALVKWISRKQTATDKA